MTAKTITFAAARSAALDYLDSEGWTVRRGLKVPHATTPDGAIRLWFKARSVHRSEGVGHRLGDARSLHVDLRAVTPAALVAAALGLPFPGASPSTEECACQLCKRRRGCFVVAESDAELPPGWCEVQRDDCPDVEPHLVHRFEDDVEAASWVSRAARAISVETGVSTVLLADVEHGWVVPRGWCPGHRVRLMVPLLDALDRDLPGVEAAQDA